MITVPEELYYKIKQIKDWRPRPAAFQLSEMHTFARHDRIQVYPKKKFLIICAQVFKSYGLEYVGYDDFYYYFY